MAPSAQELSMQAIDDIRRDLDELKSRRRTALWTYMVVLTLFVGVFLLRPTGPNALERDGAWMVSFGLLLAGTLLGTMVTIGYPLFSRAAVYGVSLLMAAGCLVAILITVDFGATGPANPVRAGMPCFVHGTAMSIAAMLVLGVVSGRVWRRFPDPGFSMALGMTGVGLAALHMQCGGVDPLHLFAFHLSPLIGVYALAHFAVRTRNDLSREQ